MIRWIFLALPVVLLAIPLGMRQTPVASPPGAQTLVIITPHNETVRQEFARAFAAWARRELGAEVVLDLRTPGGTSDIVRLVNDQFRTAVRNADFARGAPAAALARFDQNKGDAKALTVDEAAALTADEATVRPEIQRVRRNFLASEIGIGIDLFWGGGSFEYIKMADQGFLVDAGLVREMPEVFHPEVLPTGVGGEIWYDIEGRWYGTCLASFGLCWSTDRLADLGLSAPKSWDELGAVRLFGAVAMADPSKSGSVNRCFETMLQARMSAVLGDGPETPESLDRGWADGFALIKRIAGNARYVSDSASRVVRDVGRGDAAMGMCIDTYGRAEAEWTRVESGRERIGYATPVGGSSYSADPVGLLRGAPHRALAVAFIRFSLSLEGQRLWNYRVGEPGGPTQFALRRLPIRADCYGDEDRRHMSDPGEDPFGTGNGFVYHPAWTGRHFGLIRTTIKAVILDPRPELESAWRAIVAAGGPDAVPEAWREFCWLPYAHRQAAAVRDRLAGPPAAVLPFLRAWTEEAQRHYREAERLARLVRGAP